MIQLDEITLRRFKSHEDKVIQFKPGVNAIVGPNGSGKSSILQAIDFAFTGQSEETKEDLITKGSLGSSFVKVKFTLNGKPGELERHLDSSKVVLKYDGETKNKSTEVKELWSKLLQIDSHIFKHVIIAHQKRVPELFAGESSIREKAFQKIFLVPNTEKLRTTIWNNYINTAPPLLPVEDPQELQAKVAEIDNKLTPIAHKIEILSTAVLSEPQVVSVLNSIEYYKKCIKDSENKPNIESAITSDQHKKTLILKKLEEIDEDCEIDIDALSARQRDLVHNRALFSVKKQREAARESAVVLCNDAENVYQLIKDRVDAARQNLELTHHNYTKQKLDIDHLTNEIAHFKDVKGHDKCPTCKQSLENVSTFVAQQEAKLEELSKHLPVLEQVYQAAQQKLESFTNITQNYENAKAKVESLDKELLNYCNVEFNYEELEEVDGKINAYKVRLAEKESANLTLNRLDLDIAVNQSKLGSLTLYEGTSTAVEELSIMNEVITVNRERNDELQRIRLEAVQFKTELSMLNQRLTSSLANIEKNSKRDLYIEKLKTMYDTLHTAQFPRKLIQTYSTVVEEELLLNLQRFSIPYAPRIDEGFKINMINNNGYVIPTLSGGQEMIVGLCLRLALHSMFSQSFPMLIIDEGTTHLDIENAKLYFNCIRELRRDQVIKQLIIIDHNPSLADVVDHVIHTSV